MKRTATPDSRRDLSFLVGSSLAEVVVFIEVIRSYQAEFMIRTKASTTLGSKSLPLFSLKYLMAAGLG